MNSVVLGKADTSADAIILASQDLKDLYFLAWQDNKPVHYYQQYHLN